MQISAGYVNNYHYSVQQWHTLGETITVQSSMDEQFWDCMFLNPSISTIYLCKILYFAKLALIKIFSVECQISCDFYFFPPIQEFVYTATMAFFYFTAFTAQFADLGGFSTDEYAHRYAAQIVAGVSWSNDLLAKRQITVF